MVNSQISNIGTAYLASVYLCLNPWLSFTYNKKNIEADYFAELYLDDYSYTKDTTVLMD